MKGFLGAFFGLTVLILSVLGLLTIGVGIVIVAEAIWRAEPVPVVWTEACVREGFVPPWMEWMCADDPQD